MKTTFIILFLITGLLAIEVLASPTKVGNGDAGGDLEKMEKVQSGVLIQTRDKALDLLHKQDVQNITGLSKLIPELEKADVYLSSSNVSPVLNTDNQTEISADGRFVYARTFAEPHAPVRFFPAALMLSEEQIVSLHIHEALHRALPAPMNENEAFVSEITLALTSPDANKDRTQAILIKKFNDNTQISIAPTVAAAPSSYEPRITNLSPHLKEPSSFTYTYQAFVLSEEDKALLPIQGMHQLQSLIYPFGEASSVRGIGIKFSYLNFKDKSFMGPLALSGNLLFTTWRNFDIEGFIEGSAYTLSSQELKSLPKTRDTVTIGLFIKRNSDKFYTENFIALTPRSTKEFKVGNVNYREEYSDLLDARIEGGFKLKNFSIGVFGDFLLTEGSEVSSEDQLFKTEKERIRVFKIGPRVSYTNGNLNLSFYSQHVIDKTPGYDLTDFANIIGLGAGTTVFGSSLSLNY